MSKSTEEYVLQRLEALENEREERTKALETKAQELEAANADRSVMFCVLPLRTVIYELESSYVYEQDKYGFGNVDDLKAALALDDAAFYEWCTKEFGKGWNTSTPIKREENTFNYQLVVAKDGRLKRYASTLESPSNFKLIHTEPFIGEYIELEHDNEVKELAIAEARRRIKSAINTLSEDDSEE